MGYQISENIVDCKLDGFIAQYKNSTRLLENLDVRNNLIHPDEYSIFPFPAKNAHSIAIHDILLQSVHQLVIGSSARNAAYNRHKL